jgi:cell division transport system ATP-binding protein
MIELYHVSKAYERDSPALTDVSFKVDKGEFVYLTGPSGAGKTTLLKLLFAAEPVSDGQILVNGRNVNRISPRTIPALRRQIGVVFQDFKLIHHWTVYQNVAFVLEILGAPRKEIKRKTWLTLKRVQLQHKLDTYPLKLSGGEQQRVAIARALVNDPIILLADEPTGNLDPDITVEIIRFFVEINARGTTVMLATHDKHLIREFPRRVIALERGRLTSDNAEISNPQLAREALRL